MTQISVSKVVLKYQVHRQIKVIFDVTMQYYPQMYKVKLYVLALDTTVT
jgi:hypothetical protein